MNEEPPNPFDTVGDEPVEARIVAWVLGEASAFEAAELERLCEERPELLVFRRRMRALHGLLTEAEAAKPDQSWKLPPEKRRALDEIFGEEKVTRLDPRKEARIRHSRRRAILAIAACLLMTAIIAGVIAPMNIRQRKRADAVVRHVDFMPSSGGNENREVALQELKRAVRDQEDKLEEKRKVLATIARTKGIIYEGQDSFDGARGVEKDQGARNALESAETSKDDTREDAIKRGLDAQDYGNAKREFESDQQLLQQLKLKQLEQEIALKVAKKVELAGGAVSAPAQPATATASGKPETTYKLDLAAKASDRQTGAKEAARQAQIARQSVARQRVVPPPADAPSHVFRERGAGVEAPSVMPELPAIAGTGKGMGFGGGGGGMGAVTDASAEPATPAPATPAAEPAPSLQPPAKSFGGRERGVGGNKIIDDRLAGNRSDKPVDGPMAMSEPASSSALADDTSSLETARPPVVTASDSNEPIRTNPALTAEHELKSDKVRRQLYTAEGQFNLGKYDDAKKSYQEALRVDPNNSTARLGLEKVSVAKSDYYRAAHDHTRAELLAQADAAWNIEVPAEGVPAADIPSNGSVAGVGRDLKQAGEKLEKDLSAKEEGKSVPAELAGKISSLRKQLAEPALNDSKKQALSKDLKALEKSLEDSAEYEFRGTDLASEEKPAAIDLAELMEEIPAAENPYSTFSLNISDASFQVAKATLAKGERPDPASIKSEQFYNAVDYGDPAPAANEPVAATIEQAAHPVIPGRNLVRVALRTGSTGRSAVQPLRLTLLVDQSGSMVREDRRAAMEHALAQLGVLLTKNDRFSVVGFSRTPHLIADGKTGDEAVKLNDLVNQAASEGGTNLEEALKLGQQMAERHQLAGAQNRIVILTDGAANLGDADPARLAGQVKALRQKGIAFDIAGIGADGLNDRLLGELARNGNGRYYVVGNGKDDSFARQLAGAFRPAAENVKVQVNFNPRRVGKYKLIGFEKDRLKTEDFRNDAVDAAELAAEEAGVAIYQIEPLADGSGELGEVSVRFRDTAAGEMVERSWTIPYDAHASAFDRATPSMQLAGLSMLAAEKLRGGPLADATDFKQLAGSSAFVKQYYGGSPRVADMLRVIDALK